MVAGRVKRIVWERLVIVGRRLLPQGIRNSINTKYENLKLRREFHSRISRINPGEYLDVSCKPNLNVIVLVVDSLRNSRLSSQGYFRETTPFLDSLEPRFTAISASSWTYPSVASILTGLYPHNHKAVLGGRIKDVRQPRRLRPLRDDILILPEILSLSAYEIYFGSAIELANFPLGGRVIADRYDPYVAADDVLNDLTKWISKRKAKKVFAYVQLADLHPPLNPPDGFRDFFGNVEDLPNIDRWDFMTPERQKNDAEKFRDYRENRELLYDNTLRYVDCAIERFYNSIKDMGLVDSTVLIVTADHGEEFWEHAELDARSFYQQRGRYGISHGDNAYNEVIQVPLLMSGTIPYRTSTHFVSTVDIVPTVVDLLGIRHNMRFDGRNIFETEEERPLLSEACSCGYEKKSLVIGRYKLIYAKDDGIEWVFDLEKDPQEQHPIVDREVTSVFVRKLLQMLREDDRKKIREMARKKGL